MSAVGCMFSVVLVAQDAAPPPSVWRTGSGHFVRAIEVEGSRAVGLSVVWPFAANADSGAQRGLAYALSQQRAANADAVLPTGTSTQRELGAGFTVFSVLLPPASTELAGPWLQALLQPFDATAIDAAARTLAIAALLADDSDWLYPGDVLRGRARRAIWKGTEHATGVLGDAAALQQFDAAAFVNASAVPLASPLRVAVVGDVGVVDRLESLLAKVPCGPAARVDETVGPTSFQAASIELSPHPRTDAAYVAVAFASPRPKASTLATTVVIELLRSRARASFRSWRGNEPLARAPFVHADFLLGEPLVLLFRRAPTEAGPDLPRRELSDLLTSFTSVPPRETELASALGIVCAELSVPPYSDLQVKALQRVPFGLLPRARVACLLGHFGIGDADVHALSGLDINGISTSARALLGGAEWWGGLLPTVKSPFGG